MEIHGAVAMAFQTASMLAETLISPAPALPATVSATGLMLIG